MSPSLIIDGNASFARFDQTCLLPDYGTNYGTDVSGSRARTARAAATATFGTPACPPSGSPATRAFGGVDGWTPLFRNDRTYNLSLNATYVKGNHEMRFGLDIVKMELNHWQPELGYPRGYFYFSGGPTTRGAVRARPTSTTPTPSSCSGTRDSADKSLQYELSTGASGCTRASSATAGRSTRS